MPHIAFRPAPPGRDLPIAALNCASAPCARAQGSDQRAQPGGLDNAQRCPCGVFDQIRVRNNAARGRVGTMSTPGAERKAPKTTSGEVQSRRRSDGSVIQHMASWLSDEVKATSTG